MEKIYDEAEQQKRKKQQKKKIKIDGVTMLSFAELYKFYFNSKCVYQKFTIKKTISTRFNLNGPEYEKRYQKTPFLFLIASLNRNEALKWADENFKYENKIKTGSWMVYKFKNL